MVISNRLSVISARRPAAWLDPARKAFRAGNPKS